MAKHLKLQPSESVVLNCASRIYAAYISNGSVKQGEEDKWMSRSIQESLRLALAVDNAVISDDEVDSAGF